MNLVNILKGSRPHNSTYTQAGVSCFVGQESGIFEVQFFVGSFVLKIPAFGKPQTVSGQATNDITAKEEMTIKNENITFAKLDENDKIPYDLLLLADPSKDLVDKYLKRSNVFIVRQNDETIGVIVLFPLTADTVEIKNVAVKPEFQGQGIGSYLIENVVQVASLDRQKSICIGTAKELLTTTNLSVGEIAYQLGFEYSQSFSKLFKKNTTQTPLEYRQSFN